MKKQKLGLALTAVLLLTGCGGIEKMTETTVTVDDSGTVEELLLEDFLTRLIKKRSWQRRLTNWWKHITRKQGVRLYR